ncbi:hypothetical protein PMALA_073120 [Plasmodium malariae]|nr:hypothetical protein PMALA_073120 [Plasmodium malariae]
MFSLLLQIEFSKFLYESYNLGRKLDTRNYRLLAKYKENKDSYYTELKENIQYNNNYTQKNLSNCEKVFNVREKQSNRSLLNKAKYYTEVMDYNNGIFDGKYFHFKKRWIRKKDYDNFLEKNRRIGDISLKKIKFKS